MRIRDIFIKNGGPDPSKLAQLRVKCSDFIRESEGLPVLKSLPTNYNDLHKVKIRIKKSVKQFDQTFNQAFEGKTKNLRQRAIFANGVPSFQLNEGMEAFYVFPINGYKFMYSHEVQSSDDDYQHVFGSLFEHFNDQNTASKIITDILRYTYTNKNLSEGIDSGAEIVLYGIPYYYAVRTSVVENYEDLLTLIS